MSNGPAEQARTRKKIWLAGLIFLGLGAALLFTRKAFHFPMTDNTRSAAINVQTLDQRLLQTEQNVARLERERDTLLLRLTDSANRTNALRDEVLGVSDRAGLIEQNLHELSRAEHNAQDTWRISEAELLLSLAQERWQLNADADSASQAINQASQIAHGLKGAQWLNLRETLAQELAAYKNLGTDPVRRANTELDTLQANLSTLPVRSTQAPVDSKATSGFTRLLNTLVQVQAEEQHTVLSPNERALALSALHLELGLARAALQQRSRADFKASVLRLNELLRRLYADTPMLNTVRTHLLQIANQPLIRDMPLAGTSLRELRNMQNEATQ